MIIDSEGLSTFDMQL